MSEALKQYLGELAGSETASIVNIKGGALVEMFDRALGEVMQNIADINTTLAARSVTLTLTVKPSQDRSLVEWGAKVGKNLAGQEGIMGTADVRMDSRGRITARERGRQQLPLVGNVTPIKKGGEGK